jgi:hypothetical protein
MRSVAGIAASLSDSNAVRAITPAENPAQHHLQYQIVEELGCRSSFLTLRAVRLSYKPAIGCKGNSESVLP